MAEQVLAESTVIVMGLMVPEHEPDHPLKAYPVSTVAVRVTSVLLANPTWQVDPPVPHKRPLPLTVPPAGFGEIVNRYDGVNVALQVSALLTATLVVVPVPLQDPPQLEKR